jgi:hypothetical protein
MRDGSSEAANPAEGYGSPQDVLRDPNLSTAQKREVLQRWALDSYLVELAPPKGEAQNAASRLSAVIDALIDLDDLQAAQPGRAGGLSADRRDAA